MLVVVVVIGRRAAGAVAALAGAWRRLVVIVIVGDIGGGRIEGLVVRFGLVAEAEGLGSHGERQTDGWGGKRRGRRWVMGAGAVCAAGLGRGREGVWGGEEKGEQSGAQSGRAGVQGESMHQSGPVSGLGGAAQRVGG